MKERYVIRDRQAGNEIVDFSEYKKALKMLLHFEAQDKINNIYEEDFYEIYDRQNQEIVY